MNKLIVLALLSASMGGAALAQVPQATPTKAVGAQKAQVLPAPTPLPPPKEEPGQPARKRLMTPQDLVKHQHEVESTGQQVKAPPVPPAPAPVAPPVVQQLPVKAPAR